MQSVTLWVAAFGIEAIGPLVAAAHHRSVSLQAAVFHIEEAFAAQHCPSACYTDPEVLPIAGATDAAKDTALQSPRKVAEVENHFEV